MSTTIITSNWPKYDHIIKWCLEDVLLLSEYNLDITYCILLGCKGRFTRPNKIQIEQHLTEEEIPLVLFHEIRHYYQYQTKMFDFDVEKYITFLNQDNEDYEDYIKFRDEDVIRLYSLRVYECYMNFPWEVDAREFTLETLRKYFVWKQRL